MSNANTLREVGTALYGSSWQSHLSRELQVSDRTVRYWLAGREIPAGVWRDLATICQDRGVELSALAQVLTVKADAIGE